jgi:hypothetical protein
VRAEEEARRLNHEYLGTEHILLGLVAEGGGEVAAAFRTFHATPDTIRQAIAALVQPGVDMIAMGPLPSTPRARQAIESAELEATLMESSLVAPEHLLVGLMREPDGVAGRVLRELGITLERVTSEVFRTRLLQAKFVEQIVRPVRVGTPRKRKMRDELLAHLTDIYDEELARLNDPAVAWRETATRFGDPAELTREIESSLPRRARHDYYIERWIGWRAPETAQRWMLRLSLQFFVLLAMVVGLGCIAAMALAGWDNLPWRLFRGATAFLLFLPATFGVTGTLYYKMRDASFGVFGSRKSPLRVLLLAGAIALVVTGAGFGFVALTGWSAAEAVALLVPYGIAGVALAVAALLATHWNGITEIRDTRWAILDISGANPAGPDQPPNDSRPVEPE